MFDSLRAAVLDTHVWIWISAGDPRAAAAKSFHGQAIVSAISVWEVCMLQAKNRLHLLPDLDTWISTNISAPVELAPISPSICTSSVRLPDLHGDAADRLIVATAIVLGAPLLTADHHIIEWNKIHARLQIIPLE